MERFSERLGITKLPTIQLNGISTELRTSLWNVVLIFIENYYDAIKLESLCKILAYDFLKVPLDEIRSTWSVQQTKDWIKKQFYLLEWFKVYDFIEFLVQNERPFQRKDFQEELNRILERENSGYRLVNRVFTPITNEPEIKEIEEAIEKATKVGIEGAREHLSSALSLLAKKPEPDYRNSIKESISAVESVVKQISGERGGGLDKALEELSKKAEIHGALKQGFLKLYGYASDEDGIRHAILEDSNVGFDETKFMLVSCSAFVNFLFSKAQKAGLLKEG